MIVRKTQPEIEAMAKAGEIHVKTMNLLAGKVRAGVTTGELDAAAEKFIRSQGATPAFKGYRGFPGSICTSPNDMVVHGIPGRFKLRKGDILSVDIGVVKDGWVADGARTFPVGEVSPVAAKLLQVTEESLFAAVRQCQVGKRLGDVSHAVQSHVESHGLSVVRSLVGHGIGRSMHEEPQIPNYGPAGKGVVLEEGMVLAIEPMVTAGPPHGAHGRRRLGDLLPGRLARGALRVHGRDHGRGPADPHALARVRARAPRPDRGDFRQAPRRCAGCTPPPAASAARRTRARTASPSSASTAAIAVSRPSHSPRRSQSSRVQGPARGRPCGRVAPAALSLERRAARRVHLARDPARARAAPAARVAHPSRAVLGDPDEPRAHAQAAAVGLVVGVGPGAVAQPGDEVRGVRAAGDVDDRAARRRGAPSRKAQDSAPECCANTAWTGRRPRRRNWTISQSPSCRPVRSSPRSCESRAKSIQYCSHGPARRP